MANHAALNLFGKQEDEVIGEPLAAFVPSFNFARWIEGDVTRHREVVVLEVWISLSRYCRFILVVTLTKQYWRRSNDDSFLQSG